MRRIALLATLALAGCGILIGSSDDESASAPPPIPSADATVVEPPSIADAGGEADAPSDAAREAEADAPYVNPDPNHLEVVVSTSLFDPAFGSRAVADQICQTNFNTKYVAWLSESDGLYLPDRLPNNTSWWNSGVVIFANKGDLGTGPQNPLPGAGRVWTGTASSGYPGQTCGNWTGASIGTSGSLGATGTAWTNDLSSSVGCTTKLPVICFQIVP